MKKYLVILTFFLTIQLVNAESLVWFEGSIVLKTKEVRRGQICVRPEYDLILFKKGDELTVYPAHKVNGLHFYDAGANINRKFTTIQQFHGASTYYQLFEIVVPGEVRVLRRQLSEMFMDDALGFEYYVEYNHELIELRKFRTKIYPHLIGSAEMLSYIRNNKLNPNQPANAIQIIEFYNNQRSTSAEIIAKH